MFERERETTLQQEKLTAIYDQQQQTSAEEMTKETQTKVG